MLAIPLLLVLLANPPRVSAAVPVGEIPAGFILSECPEGTLEVVQAATQGANPYIVPAVGRLTSWRTQAPEFPGQKTTLKVFRPVPGQPHNYVVVGHDGPRELTQSIVNTFSTSLPVEPGDYIGIETISANFKVANACAFESGTKVDAIGGGSSSTPDGNTVALPPFAFGRVNVAATLQPRPTIAELAPVVASGAEDRPVTITGTNFEEVLGVSFGALPAVSFTVVSPTKIVAIAPGGAPAGTVDVTVTTTGGTSPVSAATKFTFEATKSASEGQVGALDRVSYVVSTGEVGAGKGTRSPGGGSGAASCLVPQLRGTALKTARKSLRAAHCRLGKVKGKKPGASMIKKQSQKVGKVLPSGAKIDVTLKAPSP